MSELSIFLGMPTRPNRFAHNRASLAYAHASLSRKYQIVLGGANSSILPHCFNIIWKDVLNRRKEEKFTHWGLIHDDVCPDPGWLDIMLEEMNRVNADFISAVVPIKNCRGTTSTAIDNPKDQYNVRRLTLHEIFKKKPTFTHPRILLNSGLFVMRMKPEFYLYPPVYWRQQDKLTPRVANPKEGEEYEYDPETISEDWDFTRQLKARGARVFATRAVPLFHLEEEFHNKSPWGTWKTDEAYFSYNKDEKEGDYDDDETSFIKASYGANGSQCDHVPNCAPAEAN